MTSKHFRALAEVLNHAKPMGNVVGTQDLLLEYWEMLVHRMAAMCRKENPRFNSTMFYAACGLKESVLD